MKIEKNICKQNKNWKQKWDQNYRIKEKKNGMQKINCKKKEKMQKYGMQKKKIMIKIKIAKKSQKPHFYLPFFGRKKK